MRLCEDTRYEIRSLFLRPYDGWHLENLGLCNSGIDYYPTSYCLGTLTIEYGNPMVENISTELGYDFQSLCGEVGGTFGLMLGLCLLDFVSLKQWNKWLLRFFKAVLWCVFLYWLWNEGLCTEWFRAIEWHFASLPFDQGIHAHQSVI